MNETELKPCPFCGGEAEIVVIKKGFKSIIACTTPHCGFMRHSFNNGDTDEHAALRLTTAWNSRTTDDKQSEWISVEDRLPDREGTYLVCTFKGARKFGVYGRYCVCDEPQFEYDVTHWMPLPEAPKGGAV